jgi:hypothetical protein
MRRDEWLEATRRAAPGDLELMERLWDATAAEVRKAKPTQPSPELLEALRGMKRTAKPPPARAISAQTPPRPTYVHLDTRVWNHSKAEWWTPGEAWWKNHDKMSRDPVLRVGDVGGATVVGGVVRRGCVVCGSRDVVHKLVTLGNPRNKAWRGGMCILCSELREREELWDKAAVLVTRRLESEGFLAKGVGDEHYLRQWSRYTWARRVSEASSPEIQEPPREPFGFLHRGPLKVGTIEEVSA